MLLGNIPVQFQNMVDRSLYQSFFEHAADAFIMATPEGQTLQVNAAACLLFGYNHHEFLQLEEFAFLNKQSPHFTELLKQLQEKGSFSGALIASQKQGSQLPIQLTAKMANHDGKRFLYLTAIEIATVKDQNDTLNDADIGVQAKREHTEEHFNLLDKELLAANERFKYAAMATDDCIWDWDIERNESTRVGNGLKRLFGYDSVKANAEKGFWMKRVHPDDVERVFLQQALVLQDPNAMYWEDAYKFQRADHTYAHVFDRGYIIRDENGKALRVIGATKDISQQKASEALLLELNARLKKRAEELANSNVELERFAYVASHDLQEPLRMINSFLQLLRKRYAGKIDHTADQYIRYALDAAQRMKQLIMDLLDYSRVGATANELETVDANSLLHELVDVFNKGQTDQPTRVKVLTSQIPSITANKTQLFQLFQNLVSNGLKYNKHEHPMVEISYEEYDAYHCFKVKDNGIGIDPSFHDKIFVLFQRVHSRTEYSGTGIGLAICKKIVDRHGGNIWIESPLEGGAVFCFTLSKSVS